MSSGDTPYVTTSGLARALNSPTQKQARVVSSLRRQRESDQGFNPWSRFNGAIRGDLRSRTGTIQLDLAVREHPKNFGPHYRELADGWARYLQSFGGGELGLAQVHEAIEIRNGLTIKINPQLGITFPDGHVDVIHLWYDAEPLSVQTAQMMLYLMQTNMAALSGGDATACVVDVRRGQPHRLPAGWREDAATEESLNGHVAQVVNLWGSGTAAGNGEGDAAAA